MNWRVRPIDSPYVVPEILSLGKHEDAFRAAAKKTHPDAGGDPEEFMRVQAARECLAGRA